MVVLAFESKQFLGISGLAPTVAFVVGGGLIMIIIAIITDAWRKVSQTRAKEESRREIAAYVAEGSMSAEDAAKLLGSGAGLTSVVKDKIRQAVEKL